MWSLSHVRPEPFILSLNLFNIHVTPSQRNIIQYVHKRSIPTDNKNEKQLFHENGYKSFILLSILPLILPINFVARGSENRFKNGSVRSNHLRKFSKDSITSNIFTSNVAIFFSTLEHFLFFFTQPEITPRFDIWSADHCYYEFTNFKV